MRVGLVGRDGGDPHAQEVRLGREAARRATAPGRPRPGASRRRGSTRTAVSRRAPGGSSRGAPCGRPIRRRARCRGPHTGASGRHRAPLAPRPASDSRERVCSCGPSCRMAPQLPPDPELADHEGLRARPRRSAVIRTRSVAAGARPAAPARLERHGARPDRQRQRAARQRAAAAARAEEHEDQRAGALGVTSKRRPRRSLVHGRCGAARGASRRRRGRRGRCSASQSLAVSAASSTAMSLPSPQSTWSTAASRAMHGVVAAPGAQDVGPGPPASMSAPEPPSSDLDRRRDVVALAGLAVVGHAVLGEPHGAVRRSVVGRVDSRARPAADRRRRGAASIRKRVCEPAGPPTSSSSPGAAGRRRRPAAREQPVVAVVAEQRAVRASPRRRARRRRRRRSDDDSAGVSGSVAVSVSSPPTQVDGDGGASGRAGSSPSRAAARARAGRAQRLARPGARTAGSNPSRAIATWSAPPSPV